MTGLRWGARTDVGRARSVNQDNVYAAAPLFAVADGMGGHAGGEVASRIALDTLAAAVPPDPGGEQDGHVSIEAFVAGVRDANRAVFDRSTAEAELRGMGTTLCALALVTIAGDERLVVVNIGDSRAYVVQDGRLLQVSRDHSYVEDLVESGEITREQAKDHPRRNIVTRALGIEPDVEIDSWEVTPYPGDRYLLCSDGLFNEVDDEALRTVLTGRVDAQAAADELVTLANEGGGHDNISVVVIDVTADGQFGPAGTGDHTDVLPRPADAEAISAAATTEAASADATPTPDRAPRRRAMKTLALPLAVLLLGAGAFAAITYFGRAGYFVAFANDNVAIYQGRPGGLLWIDPTVETTFALPRSSVPADQLRRIEEGNTFDDRTAAEGYVANVVDEAERLTAATSTTTTTTLPPTTTTLPPATTVATTLPPEVTVAADVPVVPDTVPPPVP